MSQVLRALREKAAARQKTIVFPEASDRRVLEAARQFASNGFGYCVLIDPSAEVASELPDGVSAWFTDNAERAGRYAELFHRRHSD